MRTIVGTALILVGLALVVLAQVNLSAQMDRVDREGTAGNLFALDVFWLGLAGVVAVVFGVAALMARRRAAA
ncbi:hypothetical protein Q9S78_00480 [Microbacterium sp. KSW-18]|uniref:Uncharacterized protein n=1 Tax=Microbacterium aquilitoris TaxID=3067307 RepID=A0ABU3GGX3_9MICO|nr:hypothetical protein [Microbacterium sp. KSW-18]MDT3329131.1 hypothetical protein [Microbacterium sp. KSW-18]